MSQAEFFKPNRRVVNLWRLPLCFVDLDTHKTAWGCLSPEPVSLAVRMFLDNEGIPPASLIIHSGRGLYLKWLFANALPSAALPRWNRVQRELVDRLQPFGADPNAKDASRVQLKLIQGGKRDGAIVLGYQQLHWNRLADFRALVKLRGYIDEGLIYRKNKT